MIGNREPRKDFEQRGDGAISLLEVTLGTQCRMARRGQLGRRLLEQGGLGAVSASPAPNGSPPRLRRAIFS